MKKTVRQSNFELMRILSTLMIILWHIIIHGNVIQNTQRESIKMIFIFIEFIIVVHVNSYVLITGYFQSKSNFKASKVLGLIDECWFYRIIIMIFLLFFNLIKISKISLFRALFVINLDSYWFINTYLLLYIISPFLNKLIYSLDKKQFKTMIITLFIIFSVIPYVLGQKFFQNAGTTLYNFILLYFIGAYFKIYPIKSNNFFKTIPKNVSKLIFIFFFFFLAIFNFCLSFTAHNVISYSHFFEEIGNNIIINELLYSNPFIILQSVCFFLYFETLDIKSNFINKVSSFTLGIYLIHDNYYIRKLIYKFLKIDNRVIYSYKFILYTFIITFVIFVVCSIIEWIRQIIFKFIYNRKISKKWRNYYRNWVNNCNININW